MPLKVSIEVLGTVVFEDEGPGGICRMDARWEGWNVGGREISSWV